MIWINDQFIENHIDFQELIQELKEAFRQNCIQSPPKSIYTYKSVEEGYENTFLYMPAWDNKKIFGSKLITATPRNKKLGAPYIQGIYILFDALSGAPLISMDAKLMTSLRTAATSALATSFLMHPKASTLLVLGNGNLAPYFIKAYNAIHDFESIYLWGRNKEKSKKIAQKLKGENNIEVKVLDEYKSISKNVAIISCLTSSSQPLLECQDLGTGQHLDLVGSYMPEMQEVTSEVIQKASLYADNLDSTPFHAGEFSKSIAEGEIKLNDIHDLTYLCKDERPKRKSDTEITLFKSTGMAIEDLVFANLIYKKYTKGIEKEKNQ